MRTLLAVIGAVHLVAFLAGSIGMIDYHVCIKGPGECGPHVTKGTP
jgi:hypothetical protein